MRMGILLEDIFSFIMNMDTCTRIIWPKKDIEP